MNGVRTISGYQRRQNQLRTPRTHRSFALATSSKQRIRSSAKNLISSVSLKARSWSNSEDEHVLLEDGHALDAFIAKTSGL